MPFRSHAIVSNVIKFSVGDNITVNDKKFMSVLEWKYVNKTFWNVINSLSTLHLKNKRARLPNQLSKLHVSSEDYNDYNDYNDYGNGCQVNELVVYLDEDVYLRNIIKKCGLIVNKIIIDECSEISITDELVTSGDDDELKYNELIIKKIHNIHNSYSDDYIGSLSKYNKLTYAKISLNGDDNLNDLLPTSITKLIIKLDTEYKTIETIDLSKLTKLTHVEIHGYDRFEHCDTVILPTSVETMISHVYINNLIVIGESKMKKLYIACGSYGYDDVYRVIRVPYLPKLKKLEIHSDYPFIIDDQTAIALKECKVITKYTNYGTDYYTDNDYNNPVINIINEKFKQIMKCKNLEELHLVEDPYDNEVTIDITGMTSLQRTYIETLSGKINIIR